MKSLTADINLDAEVTHLAEFIRQKWTPIANLDALFTEIRDAAMKAARSWFDSHPVWEAAHNLKKARRALLEGTYGNRGSAELFDALYIVLDSISGDARDLSNAGQSLDGRRWNFEGRAKNLELGLCDRYPDLATSRPHGWDELAEGYRDFDGQDDYEPEADIDLFKGVKVQSKLSSHFTDRVALPFIFYDERSGTCRASRGLVESVYAHFLGITEFLNTHRLVQDLATAFPQLQEPHVLFERVVTTDNPFLKVAIEVAPPVATPAQLDAHLAQIAAFSALSDEEKAQRQAEGAAAVMAIIDGLKKDSSAEDERKHQAELERKRSLLRAAFA